MRIRLMLDEKGEPYLDLVAEEESEDDEKLLYFVKEAKMRGIKIESEASPGDNFASIRLGEKKDREVCEEIEDITDEYYSSEEEEKAKYEAEMMEQEELDRQAEWEANQEPPY